jgi:hypothetical protein
LESLPVRPNLFGRELFGGRKGDAAAATGDEGDFVLEL